MCAALDTLRDCCRTLASDKLRDRRESADKLRQLVSDNETLCAELDAAGRDRDRLNWAYVWEHAVTHFQKEMVKAEDDARRGKNATQRELVPRQAVSLLRAVAHRANRGSARLDAAQVAAELLAALRHPFRREAAGPELCALLTAALLEPPPVRAELTLTAWRELLAGARSLLAEPPQRLQTHVLRSLLAQTAELGCRQTALLARVRGLLPLLAEDGLLREAAPAALRLVNVLLRLTAAGSRRALCRLGERLFVPVCQLADARHHCQEEVLAFLQLQLCARSPLCRRATSGEEVWTSQLKKMYQLVVDEVDARCRRSRLVGRAAQSAHVLPDSWVSLFTGVAYLLFEEGEDTVLDVTQIPSLSAADGRPAKRRRLEVGVRAICERVYETRGSTECVPWLQLLAALLTAHPDALGPAQLPPCLSLLVSLLASDSRVPEVVRHQLRLAATLLGCPAAHRVPARLADDVAAAWIRVWELAVQASSLVQCQDASHALLQAMLRRRAARPGLAFLALYLQRETVPGVGGRATPPLVISLLEYLRRFAVPQPSGLADDPMKTRLQLADWLLESRCEPRAVAEALVRLALRDNTADLGGLADSWDERVTASADSDWYAELGVLYVRSEVLEPLRSTKSRPAPRRAVPPSDLGEAAVTPLKTRMLAGMAALVMAAERRDGDAPAGGDTVLQWCDGARQTAVRAATLLRLAGDCGLLSDAELRHSPLAAALRSLIASLLRAAAGELAVPLTDDRADHVTALLVGLQDLFTTAATAAAGTERPAAAGRRALGRLLAGAVPRAFVQAALKLLRDEAGQLLPQSRRTSQSDPLSDSFGFSPLESDFSDAELSSAPELGRDSVLETPLLHLEEVRLQVCLTLVALADVDVGEDGVATSEGDAPDEVLSDVFVALLDGRMEVRYPGDINIAFRLLRRLPSAAALRTSHVASLSELLLLVCRAWPRDVTVNAAVLDAMAGGYVQAAARIGCGKDRLDVMKFVKVMLKKAETARFGEQCLLSLLRLLTVLAEQDPAGRWALLDGVWAAHPVLTHLGAPAEPDERGAGVWSTHCSRLLAAELLERVFAARERLPADEGAAPPVQDMFELVYPAAICSMALKDERGDEWTRPDDAPNRAGSLCLALCRVALGSGQCRPQALLALCQASRLRDVSAELVLRALRQLATALGLGTPRRLLEAHLDFIVSQWLAEQLPVLNFPHQLLEFGSASEFVREELGCVVPHLLGRHQDQLADVAALLERQPASLVLACIPQIVAQVVLGLAGDAGTSLAAAQRLYSRARELVGGSETFDRALAAQTVDVVAALFRAHGARPEGIRPALRFAADSMYGCSLVLSLQRPADGLQRLLLQLATDVAAAAGSADRLLATRRYCALLDLLADDFAHLGQLRPFVMMDVTAFVSHRLATLQLPLEAAAAELYARALGRLGLVCAEKAPDALVPVLERICAALVRLHEACSGEECALTRAAAAAPLSTLLGPLSDGYRPAVEALTCLPAAGPLSGLTAPPAAGVLHRLAAGGALNLHALRAALAQLEGAAAAAADCSAGLLARLLRLAGGEGGELRRAAARLLGAIGPRPLEGATLHTPPPVWECTEAVAGEEKRDVHLLERLHQLLADEDVGVVSAAGDALRAVLAGPSAPRLQNLLTAQVPSLAGQLFPFFTTRQSLPPANPLSASEALRRLDSAALWVPEHGRYELWLQEVTLALLEVGTRVTPVLAAFAPLCRVKGAQFCRDVLPYAAHATLLSDTHLRGTLSRWINRLLQEHHSLRRRESCAVVSTPTPTGQATPPPLVAEPRCLQALLDVLLYLRQQPLPPGGRPDSPWERNFWLELQLPAAACAALRCGRYCDAVLLAEVCCYAQQRDDAPLLARSADSDELRALLREAHVQLGDADGVAALRTGGSDALGQVVHLQQEGEWQRALASYDALAAERTEAAQRGLLRCLAELQLLGTAQTLLRGLTAELGTSEAVPPHLLEASCEAAWRLADWSAPCPPPTAAAAPGLQQSLLGCLVAYRDGDVAAAAEAVELGRSAALRTLAGPAAPTTHAAGLCLSQLRMLWCADQLCQAAGGSTAQLSVMCSRWRDAPAPRLAFRLEEPQLAFGAALLAVLAERQPAVQEAPLLRQHTLLRLSERARAAGRLEAAERAAGALLPAHCLEAVQCRAENSWARGDAEAALWQCRSLLEEPAAESEPAARRLQLAQLKVLYAGWLSEVHREGPQAILEQHLAPAIEQLEKMTNGADSEKALLEAHYLAGQYADSQFCRVDELVTSPDFAEKRAEAARMREEAEKFRKRSYAPGTETERKDFARQHLNLTRSAELDETELRQAEEDRAAFQRQAVASYLRCLLLGRRRDLLIYRLVALWLADSSGQVCELLRPAASRLPAFKLVPLLYQLAARLGRPRWLPASAQLLEELLERCATEHPHHTLPVLLALKNAHADAAGGAAPTADPAGEQRTAAATRLVKRLHAKPALAEPLRQLEAASAALVELAYHAHRGAGSTGRVPSGCGLLKLEQLPAVAVQTVPLPVRADGDYSAASTVLRWDDKYTMVGGVNAPKKLRCLGSDGLWRPQLLKGRDDLRQDAVMQQVFSVLNLLLAESADPDQPPLAIRTYKVVPLSQRSGLIEWCVDTQPLAEYLTDGGRGGAHARYRPEDMSPSEARRAMNTVAKKSAEHKRRMFADVCRRLKPVLRHFFFERFPDPCAWYERRVAYTSSVAASSISGYVLGLGDRHVSNILIDQASAEVVHIDLGVAFDTGRLLPTPETVPFRLTRDLVDGMGVAGVEGRFRRACERTLAVLRESRQVVLTIVRVLLDDPLYAWTLTADKVNRLQQRDVDRPAGGRGDGDNRQAERALARLAEKLRGQELGQVMTCAAQVSHLIQQARDPDNLCRLFSGWQAYL